jgi:tetratricopeptide (TPR) repeat protein
MESSSPAERAHKSKGVSGSGFVGRQPEMAELQTALEDVLSGGGRLVMLVGEPGIGKSRTARELATGAEQAGAQVLWGWCYEGEGAPPFWPWVQPLRSYVLQTNPEALRSQMGPGAAAIAELIPEAHARLPGLKPPPDLDSPEQTRFRLFDSITTFLKNMAQAQPLVLVLDDLHWADKPSLLLLQFLARQLDRSRLLVLGCYRDVDLSRQHPLAEALGELTREQPFRRVLLRGLNQGEVGNFIEIAASVTPPRGLVEVVHRHTEGNPLFVGEIVRLLIQEGELTPDGAGQPELRALRIPEGVREVIGRRLNRLSPGCNQTLSMASVIGQEFSLSLLSLLIEDLAEDGLLEALEEALAARLIEELPRAVGRYQFTHRLVQETLAQELSLNRRVRLHARVAEALEALYGDHVEAHAAELAYHFAQAETVTGPEKVARYSLLAGEQALAAYAYEDALAHFQRGLGARELTREGQPLSPGSEPALDGETADLLFGLGRGQAATLGRYDYQQYLSSLRRAFDYYVSVGVVDRAVAVVDHYMTVRVATGVDIGRTRLVSDALALVTPNSQKAGRLLCAYGYVLYQETGDYQGAQEAFGRALAIARREQDEALEMRTLCDAAGVDNLHNRMPDALEKARRALQLARKLNDLQAEVQASGFNTEALRYLGDLDEARKLRMPMLSAAEKLGHRGWLALAYQRGVQLAKVGGEWQAARELSDRGLAVAPRDPRLLCTRTVLEYELGDYEQGKEYYEQLVDFLRGARWDTEFA